MINNTKKNIILQKSENTVKKSTEALFQKLQAYPNTMHDYGITENDLERIESNPEKYLRFSLYLLSRNKEGSHVYENEDALPSDTLRYWLTEFVKNNTAMIRSMETIP